MQHVSADQVAERTQGLQASLLAQPTLFYVLDLYDTKPFYCVEIQ